MMIVYSSPLCPYKGDRVIVDRICRIAILNARKLFSDVLCTRNEWFRHQVQQDVAVATLLIPVGTLIMDILTTTHKDGEMAERYIAYGKNMTDFFDKCIERECGRNNVRPLLSQFAERKPGKDMSIENVRETKLCPVGEFDLCGQFVIDVLSRIGGCDLRADKGWLLETLLEFYAQITDEFLPVIDYFVGRTDRDVEWDRLPIPVIQKFYFGEAEDEDELC